MRLAIGLIVSLASWGSAEAQDGYERLQCAHAERMREFARSGLIETVEKYRRCLDTGGVLGCASQYDQIRYDREKYQRAIDEAESACLFVGPRASGGPQP